MEAWSRDQQRSEVVGESYRPESFKAIYRARGIWPDRERGTELRTAALVVADEMNPHDRNAVAIWVEGHHVGYIARTAAAPWSIAAMQMRAAGDVLEVPARVWARSRQHDDLFASVQLDLPPVAGVVPLNGMPAAAHRVLPAGPTVQVYGEEHHLEALRPYANGHAHVSAVLHAVTEQKPRSTQELVEVRINDLRVGTLSKVMSTRLLPSVREHHTHGLLPVARAAVSTTTGQPEVTLFLARGEMSQDHGGTIPPSPTRGTT